MSRFLCSVLLVLVLYPLQQPLIAHVTSACVEEPLPQMKFDYEKSHIGNACTIKENERNGILISEEALEKFEPSAGAVIGEGLGDNKVYAVSVGGRTVAALKVIRRTPTKKKSLKDIKNEIQNEVRILKKISEIEESKALPFPEIYQAAIYEYSQEKIIEGRILMSLVRGVELFKVYRDKKFRIGVAARVIRKIAKALQILHSHGIAHLDLKPENVMLLDDGLDYQVSLVDFGSAHLLDVKNPVGIKNAVGSYLYMAPEVVACIGVESLSPLIDAQEYLTKAKERGFAFEADFWSLGVLAYELIYKRMPFNTQVKCHAYFAQVLDPKQRIRYSMKLKLANDFIKRFLVRDPSKRRCDWKQVLRDPFLAIFSS